jgi:hypothetical protein
VVEVQTGLHLEIQMDVMVDVVEELHLTLLKVLEEMVQQDKDMLEEMDLLDLCVMLGVEEEAVVP